MGLNPFDEAVDELPRPQGAPARTPNPYDAVADEMRTEQTAKLRTTALQASTQSPDRAAEARKYADRYGLPPSVVESNFDAFKTRAQLDDVAKVATAAPKLGEWLAADPSHAAVAADDHAPLSKFDRTMGFAHRILADPANSLLQGAISLPEGVVGLLDIATLGRVGQGLEHVGYQPELAKSILSNYYSKAQSDANQSVHDADGMLATAVAALSHPSVILHSVLQSAPILLGAVAGGELLPFLSPAVAGAVSEGAQQAGAAAEQSRVAPPPPSTKLAPGQVTPGTVNLFDQPKVKNADGTTSTVDSVGVNVDGKELLLPTVTRDGRHFAGTEAERVDQAIAEYKRTGQHLGIFDSPASSTAYAQQLHNDYAAGKYEPENAPKPTGVLTLKQAALAASSGIVTGAIGALGGRVAQALGIADVETMLAGGAVSPTARRGLATQLVYGAIEEGILEEFPQSISEQIHQNAADGRPLMEGVNEAAVLGALAGAAMGSASQVAEHVQERFLHDIGEAATESKTVARAPAAAEEFLAGAMKGGPLETVYAPIDTFTQYWQGQGQDPAAIAAALTGDPEAYPTAVRDGDENLSIPTARYVTQLAGTEHHAFFEKELRVSPDLQNARERAAYEAEQGAADTTTTDAPPTKREQMRGALTEQLTKAGYLSKDAEANARVVEAGIGTMAEAAGEDPFDVYAGYGLEVTRPDLPAAPAAAAAAEPAVKEAAQQAAPPAAAPRPVPTAEQRIAELEADLRSAQRAAERDPLTGVANRVAFDKALATAEADPNTHVVVFDANNFGKVNKVLGHEAGDTMLKEMSSAIVAAAKEFGVGERVFRRGGDEFVVLAPADVADKVRARAEELFGQKPITSPDFLTPRPTLVSLSGTSAGTFAEADATLQGAKQAAKDAQDAAQQVQPGDDPLTDLKARGVAYGPEGLKVRVLPTSGPDGEFELEVTQKGERSFEGKFTLEEAQAAGAARMAELIAGQTKAAAETPAAAATPAEPAIAPPLPAAALTEIVAAATAEPAAAIAETPTAIADTPPAESAAASTYTPEPLTAEENVEYRKLLKQSNKKKGKALTPEQRTALADFTRRAADQAQLGYLESLTDERLLAALSGNRSPRNKSRALGLPAMDREEQQILHVIEQRGLVAPPRPVPVPVGQAVAAALPRVLAVYNELPLDTVKAELEHLEGQTVNEDDEVDAWPDHFPMDAVSDFEEAGGPPTQEGWQALTDRTVSALHRLVVEREGQQALPLDETGLSAAPEAPIVEEVAHEPAAPEPERSLEPGADAGAGDTGEPAGRPGDARAQAMAAEQPDAGAPVSAEPVKPKRPRKPRAPKSGAGVRAGAPVTGEGVVVGGSGGTDAPAHVDTADVAADPRVAAAEARGEQPRHFVIDDAGALTDGGWTAKLDDNLSAIRLLKALDKEQRLATDAEQAVLARYIGWGHTNLAPIVDLIDARVRERDPRLQKARGDLEGLLTAAELRELGESTPNAHYSFNDLPRAMWAAVEHLGFTGGSILEPAVGSGHFLGTMPGALVGDKRTRLWAVEKEPIAAGIAKHLYQDAHVQNSPLQEANLPNDYYDLVISNVPFGRIRIFDPAFTSSARGPIASSVHNYYFGKALDVVRPGGIIAFITSRYTMDARAETVRAFLAERADLLGAVRLPDQAFRKTAGTDVVTDVIFLRKRLADEPPGGHAWVQSIPNEQLSTKQRAIHTNEYFQAHPEHVLGVQNLTGSMARTSEPQYNVQGTVSLERVIGAALQALPANVYQASSTPPRTLAPVISRDVKQGSFQIEKGELYLYDQGTLAPAGLTGVHKDRAIAFVPLRDAYQSVLDTMSAGGTDAELKKSQAALLAKYKAFVKEHGRVNLRENRKVIELDPNGGRVLALEEIEVTKGAKGRPAVVTVTGLAEIFSKRTVVPVVEATTVGEPLAALTQSLAWKGAVDLPYMQGLTGQTADTIASELAGQIFRDPVTQVYTPRAEYLSGDVTTKLAQAQAAAATDASYAANVAELTKVLPVQFTAEDFPAPFGATWVPIETYKAFLRDETHVDVGLTLTNSEARVKFYVEAGFGRHEFLPEGERFSDWIAAALNGEMPQITAPGPTKGSTVVDVAATEAYRESLQQLRERWAEWWPGNPEASETLAKIYNGMFNREAPYVADGSHVVLPNANPAIKLRAWQKNVIWRVLQTGNTLIAHAVGAGKTFAMIAVAGEWKRQGLANKPMVVAPNHLTEQWRREFLRLYPAAKILVPQKEDFTPGNRQRLIARIANNDWDAVIMAQSQFLSVSVKEATLRTFIQEQEDQLLADGAEQMGMSADEFQTLVTDFGAGDKVAVRALSSRSAPRSVKDIARAVLSLRARLQKRLDQNAKHSPVTFEELGVDGLLIDEAHLYKNLYFSTAKNNIAGLKGSDAGRAMDMFLKVRHINQTSNGRNVVFATGTPISNAISELYTMFRYLAQPQLDRLGMAGFDSWANGNAEARGEMEPSPGGGYKERIRLRKWTNLRELSAQFRKFADVVSTEDLVKSGAVTLPTTKNGSPSVVALDAAPEMEAFTEELRQRIEALKTGKVDPKVDNHLLITTQAALSAIDMRLVKPETPFDPNGRINKAAMEIASRYHASTATNGTQLAFLDVGVPNVKQMPALPESVIGKQGRTPDKVTRAVEADADETEDAEDIVDVEAEGEAAMAQIRAAGSQIDLYGELRRLLVAEGIPDNQIAYVHQAVTPYEQGKLFAAVKDGRIRVLIGSTAKGGTGMNVQDKMVAIHHLDVPWRPADVEQRNGRVYRQGNENSQVDEVRYVTKKSFDEYRWGLLATKQASIVALMKGELTSMDDVDPAQLDMQTAQALASGDPRTLDMLNKEREVKALQTRYLAFTRKLNSARRAITSGLDLVESYTARIDAMTPVIADAKAWAQQPVVSLASSLSKYGGASAGDVDFDVKDTESRKALQAHVERIMASEPWAEDTELGSAGPFTIRLLKSMTDVLTGKTLEHRIGYYLAVSVMLDGKRVAIGSTPEWTVGSKQIPQFVRSLDTYLDPSRLSAAQGEYQKSRAGLEDDIARQREIAEKPFTQIEQLKAREAELSALRVALGIERATPAAGAGPDDAGGEWQTVDEVSAKPPKSFDQPDRPDVGRRGNIRFGTDPLTGRPQTAITLPPNADLSTFLHETAHLFLEVFGDMVDKVEARDPATRTRSQTRLLDDYAATLQELGVANRGQISTPQHEQWATQFERYLMEGEAPSVELRSAFARFRAWLLDIYRSLRNIGTPLSPELRGIFDRMLAGEDEIDAAERDVPPLFTNAEQAGMNPQRFAQYRVAMEEAHRATRERLDAQIAKEVRAERSEQRQERRGEILATVTTELQNEPVYRALAAMEHGTTPAGEPLIEGEAVPLQLSRAELVAQFGEDRVAALPPGIVSTTDVGTSADLVASFFGFSSGDELLQAVTAAPPLDTAIAAETDSRLAAAFPTMLTDGTLHDRARDAAAGTDRDALIRAEVKALYQKRGQTERSYERRWLEAEAKLRIAIAEGHKQVEIDALTKELQELKAKARGGAAAIRRALPSAETLKAAADARVRRTKLRDLKPALFWTAARQAAKRAIELAAKQDIAGAIEAKTQELTNLANHRATVAAMTDAGDRRDWIAAHDTPRARALTGRAGEDYLDQWDGMLDRFEFKKVSRKVLDRRAALAPWIAAQRAAGLPIDLPAVVLNDALKTNYLELTVEQFEGATDALKSLVHLARLKVKLLREQERRSFEEVRDELAASIREKSPKRDVPLEFRPGAAAAWRSLENAVASHSNLSTFGFQLDGNAYNGPFWEHIVRPANEAGAAEEVRNIAAGTAYHAIIEAHYPGREVLTFGERLFIPEIEDSLSKEARLVIAMNWGNQSSRDRVLADPFLKWTPRQVAAVLDTLDKRDWDFVQAHWDYLNTYWPEIAEKSRRLTGLPPEKVEPIPVVTKFGTYPGGYHPLVYDARKSPEVNQQAAISEAQLAVAGAALHATTRRGHEESRAIGVKLPLRLDMAATTMHLQQVIHDLTHHEFLIDATRLLRDKEVASAIHDTRGAVMQQKLAGILLDIASGDRAGGRPTLIENGAAWLRQRSQVAGLAYNLWSAIQQPLGIFNGMERVGIGWVAKGAGIWARDAVSMQHTVDMIFAKSPMMQARYGTATQDIHDLRQTLSAEGGWFDRLVRTVTLDHATQRDILDSYMAFMHVAQMFADKPTWLGEYLKQMDEDPTDEPRAIAAADQAVLDSQGGGQIKDLAEVQRGGQVAKLFMTFASYSTMLLNSTARAAGQTNFKSPASVAAFAGHLAMLYALPAFFTEMLRCGVGRARCNEVPEFLSRVGGQSVTAAINGVLYLREVAGGVNLLLGQDTGARGYAGPAGTRVFEVLTTLATQLHQGKLDKGLERAAFAASGLLFKYPAAQAQRSVDGFIALQEGKTHNPLALLFGPPLKTKSK